MPRSTAQLCEPTNTVLAKKRYRTQERIGRSRGGLTTKIHATCDALCNPTGFHLSPGQAHELQGANLLLEALLDQIEALLQTLPTLQEQGLWIAWSGTKWKQYRGIATRDDKRACAFLGGIHWVAAVIWLN